MPKALVPASHLTADEVEQRYKKARDVDEQRHWLILRLLLQGHGPGKVGQLVGCESKQIRRVVHRYNKEGPEGLVDKRHHNPGRDTLLDDGQLEELAGLLEGKAPDGGEWTGPKAAAWMSDKLGRPVQVQRGWDYLVRLGFSFKSRRPAHTGANAEQQQEWKRNPGTAGGAGSSSPS